ncbi:hypothetical protein [Streptomyces sp. RKAG293]|uniref:hypothetical protein n=1 Tax=Streptomyces sp. RKAG293 TaxID=2893403 RepID=UPI0020348324|nr:hypothetical protein [Streptomyces sp. RKAG293]MCM2424223.1 hypothetical protein [Streptomyces sp. RKAG293]
MKSTQRTSSCAHKMLRYRGSCLTCGIKRYRRTFVLYAVRGAATGVGTGAVGLVALYARHRL